jgi:hypothetical protein
VTQIAEASMDTLLVEAFKGLIAAGPVAIVLGLLCHALWKKTERQEAQIQKLNDRSMVLAGRAQRAVESLAVIERQMAEVDREVEKEYDHLDDTRRRLGRKEDL